VPGRKSGRHRCYGQNIFSGIGKPYGAFDASQGWYSEKVKGNFHNQVLGMMGMDQIIKVGHYTQEIWKSTTAVGIGQAFCPSGRIIITANYTPPGNDTTIAAY
jgi:pathogenesis-related protein 1